MSKNKNSSDGYIEQWKYIEGFDNMYMISNFGRVMSMYKNRIKRTYVCKNGYEYVMLSLNKKKYNKRVNRLVAIAFIPNPDNKKEVNHIDGNKLNNVAWNLEWNSYSENLIHAYKNGLRKRLKLNKDDIEYIKSHYKPRDNKYSARALARKYNTTHKVILDAINGKTYKFLEDNYE